MNYSSLVIHAPIAPSGEIWLCDVLGDAGLEPENVTASGSNDLRIPDSPSAAESGAVSADSPPSGPAAGPDGGPELPAPKAPESGDGELRGDRLAEAIAAVQQLPLTDAEKAEAVRRLLAR